MGSLRGFGLAIAVVACAADARAQLVEAPVGAIGGVFGGHHSVDPNRNSQSFESTFDVGGGYDRDPNVLLFTQGEDAPDLTRWYAGSAAATARYRAGSVRRNIDVRGRTYMNYQSNAGDSLIGGEGIVNGVARFGQRRQNELTTELQSSYEPGWVFGAFGPSLAAGPETPAIGVAPPFGVFEQRWLIMSGNANYRHTWTPRHITTLGYDNRRLRPIEGGGLESDWQVATLEQSWALSPRFSLLGTYRFDTNVQRDDDSTVQIEPVRYQTFDGGVRYERRFSPVRRYSVSFRAGVTRLFESASTSGSNAAHPSLTGTAEFVPSRRFSLSAEYTRGVMVLAGVSAIPVVNDTAELSVNGTPTRRLRYSLFASAARAVFLTPDPDRSNQTDVLGTSAELRYAFSNWAAAFTTYGFYHHRIRDAQLTASGFPSRYDRHSLRVGITLWVPLYGTF